MNKSTKSFIYKGNVINFIVLTFTSLLQTGILIIISLMLEKIMAIASARDLEALYTQGLIFIVLFILSVLMFIIIIFLKPKYQKIALVQFKNNIYNQIIDKNISNFTKCNTSAYISILTNDIYKIEEDYLFSSFDLITNITLFITTIIIMFIYSPLLTISGIVLSLLPFIGAIIVGGKLAFQEKDISNQNASFMHFLKDNLIGFSTIKVFGAENKIKEIFKKNNHVLETKKAKKTRIISLVEMVQSILSLVSQFGVFFIGAIISISTGKISPSVILLFVQLMNYIINPLMLIPTTLSKRLSCKPIFKKIDDILKIDYDDKNYNVIEYIDDVTIKDLTFGYSDQIILNNLNYTFRNNKSYVIVGPSGSGKSTLLNLLIGKESNYTGEIIYNDIDLKNISLDSLFEVSSFVEQSVFVFDDTIINNITMYASVDETELRDVIVKSGLKELIREKGKDFLCGENGCNLSGGEKQRISIARALLKKSQLLLLDEVTSALDNNLSLFIINNILQIQDATKIMITHNLNRELLEKFDEIIVMKNGIIVDSGKYDELINNNSIFKSLIEFSK